MSKIDKLYSNETLMLENYNIDGLDLKKGVFELLEEVDLYFFIFLTHQKLVNFCSKMIRGTNR